MNIAAFQPMMVAFLKRDVAHNDPAIRRSDQHNIRFDHTPRKNYHPRTDAAVMPDTTSQYDLADRFKFAVDIRGTKRFLSQQVEISKRVARANKAVAPDYAHLQARILRHDGAFHHRCQVKRAAEGQKAVVRHRTEHQIAALVDADIIADGAVVDDDAGADEAVIANRRRAADLR